MSMRFWQRYEIYSLNYIKPRVQFNSTNEPQTNQSHACARCPSESIAEDRRTEIKNKLSNTNSLTHLHLHI